MRFQLQPTDPGLLITLAITRLLTLPIGISIWFTFLAPRRYHDRIQRRSAPAHG